MHDPNDSRVTLHMAASLDGFIARKDGRVDWMETQDEYPAGENLDPEVTAAFLATIDCYVMGARTYETALGFEAQGFGWAYGDKPLIVLTSRDLPRTRASVEFRCGDLADLLKDLRAQFRNIWIVGGAAVCGACMQRGLADELRYTILPVAIGSGQPFFAQFARDAALHLREVKAYRNGMVGLWYELRRDVSGSVGK